jgi:hypothetical protein
MLPFFLKEDSEEFSLSFADYSFLIFSFIYEQILSFHEEQKNIFVDTFLQCFPISYQKDPQAAFQGLDCNQEFHNC